MLIKTELEYIGIIKKNIIMKKQFLLSAVLAMICSFTYGQTNLGIKGGLVLSSMKFSQPSTILSDDNRAGYQLGIILDSKNVGGLGFQIGGMYSVRGSGDIKIDMITIPIQLRLYPLSHVFVGGGIEGGMVLNDFPQKSIGLTALTEAGIYLSDRFYISGGINFGLNETIELEGDDGIIGNGGTVDRMYTLSANVLF